MTDSLRKRSSFFLIQYFVQGAIGIIYEPLDYVLKDQLKLTAGQAAGFMAWMTLPLLFKPLYGLVTDFLPIGGYRRKPHLLMGSLLATLMFFIVAGETHYRYLRLLLPMTLACFALAVADTACGGLLIEDGKERDQTGRYQALHIGALYFSVIVTGFGSGWMTSHLPYPFIFFMAGLLPLITMLASFYIHEERSPSPSPQTPSQFWKFFRTKQFYALGITIVLWNFYPFLGTVQFYYQSNVLGLNPQWIGSLMSIGSIMGLLGSAVYWKFCRDTNISRWVIHGPVVMAFVSLSYMFYQGPISVIFVEVLFGFTSVFFRLALLDLITRSCPAEAEATSYALFLLFFDFAMYGSNAIGGRLYDVLQKTFVHHAHHDQWSSLVLIGIGSLCTLSCRWTLPAQEKEVPLSHQ